MQADSKAKNEINPNPKYDEAWLELDKKIKRDYLYNNFIRHFIDNKNESEFPRKRFYWCVRTYFELGHQIGHLEEKRIGGDRYFIFSTKKPPEPVHFENPELFDSFEEE